MNCILNKTASIRQGSVGDIVTFKVAVVNNSGNNFFNVIVKDLLPSELKFILGSVCVDHKDDSYANILSGVHIGNIDAGKTKVITFDAEIIKNSRKPIFSDASVEYSFKSNGNMKSGYAYSDIYEITIKNPSVSLSRECNKENVLLDDTIKYTIKISNDGDLDVLNLFLIESIPNNIELIDGSFSIDDVCVNSIELDKGIMIEGIPKGSTKLISYCARVISSTSSNIIHSSSKVRYSYILQNGLIGHKETDPVYCVIKMAISSFKQIGFDKQITIHNGKPDICEINDLKATIKITNYNIIHTSIAKSSEGKLLSGNKLIIHGVINQILEYVADDVIQSVNTDSFSTPFSSYIILPKDYNLINKINIESSIENIYYDTIDSRNFFESINILLTAKSNS